MTIPVSISVCHIELGPRFAALFWLKLNKDIDISISIKDAFRYFHLAISAGQTMFNNTENSKIFLNFYEKYIYYILNYKKIRWHIDQIVLYIAYIMTKRIYNVKIIDNSNNNNFKQKDSFFYHSFFRFFFEKTS